MAIHSCEVISLRLCNLAGGIIHFQRSTASCRYAGTARCTGFRKEGGRVVEVEAEYACLPEGAKAPKVRDSCLCLCKSVLQAGMRAH